MTGGIATAEAGPGPKATRTAFQYTGGAGLTTFVRANDQTWIVYPENKRTQIYVEVERDAETITLRRPNTSVWFRLHADHCEIRKGETARWNRLAKGAWLPDKSLSDFDQFGATDYRIRVVYLVPSDRRPKPNYEQKIKVVLSLAAELYLKDLRAKGYTTDGLKFEASEGQPVVHLLRSDKPAGYYNNGPDHDPSVQFTRVGREILDKLGDPARHVVIVFAETYEEGPAREAWAGHVAQGSGIPPDGGLAVYSTWFLRDEFCALSVDEQKRLLFDDTPIKGRSAFGHRSPNSPRFEFIEDGIGALSHELGHALGLPHDKRKDQVYIMGNGFRNLRFNFRSSSGRRVGFSEDNARLLMSSRYLAKDLNHADYDSPQIDLELTRRANAVTVTVNATDESGLRAMVLVDRMRPAGSVIYGQRLRGKRQLVQQRLPASLLRADEVKIEVFVADEGGNYARTTKSLRIGNN